jgi:hypothetical protein
MGHDVLSGRALENLKTFLAEPAREYATDRPREPYGKILDWALDPDHGGLPRASAQPFANWLNNVWDDWAEDPQTTTREVLEGAITDWCGGRTMPV